MKVISAKFVIMVADMARALRFYRDALGLAPAYESPHWCELSVGGAVIALHGGGGEGARTRTGITLQVDDLAAATEAVRRAGGGVAGEPRERRSEGIVLADVVDTEGNAFTLTAAIAKA